jgi:hypothetical protein
VLHQELDRLDVLGAELAAAVNGHELSMRSMCGRRLEFVFFQPV